MVLLVVRDPTPTALSGVAPMFFVLISNRWALDFSVLLKVVGTSHISGGI